MSRLLAFGDSLLVNSSNQLIVDTTGASSCCCSCNDVFYPGPEACICGDKIVDGLNFTISGLSGLNVTCGCNDNPPPVAGYTQRWLWQNLNGSYFLNDDCGPVFHLQLADPFDAEDLRANGIKFWERVDVWDFDPPFPADCNSRIPGTEVEAYIYALQATIQCVETVNGPKMRLANYGWGWRGVERVWNPSTDSYDPWQPVLPFGSGDPRIPEACQLGTPDETADICTSETMTWPVTWITLTTFPGPHCDNIGHDDCAGSHNGYMAASLSFA